jgi:hypothetical protein
MSVIWTILLEEETEVPPKKTQSMQRKPKNKLPFLVQSSKWKYEVTGPIQIFEFIFI